MCDPSLTRAILSALSPVHTSDNVSKNGDIVAETGDIDAKNRDNVAKDGDIFAKNGDIVAEIGNILRFWQQCRQLRRQCRWCGRDYWQQCCLFRRQCRGFRRQCRRFWRHCRWCGRGFRCEYSRNCAVQMSCYQLLQLQLIYFDVIRIHFIFSQHISFLLPSCLEYLCPRALILLKTLAL